MKLFGIGKEVAEPVEVVGKALDGLFTSDEERLTKTELLERTRQNPTLWQVEINKEEARHSNIFVSGWRPFVGWVCGAAFAYHFILQPFLIFLFAISGAPIQTPVFDMEALFTVLFGLLGLGGLRTFEKTKGVAK